MAEHHASCQCGALEVHASEDPYITIACHCNACQKRTGSAFATVAYFKEDVIEMSGDSSGYGRTADSGDGLENRFCPSCGTTVYWTLDMRPDSVGVLIGAFDTPRPEPVRTVWTSEKRDWVTLPAHWDHFPKGSPKPSN